MTVEQMSQLNVVLTVDKPVGPTSFDVVRRIRRAARRRDVGHGGTLDPLASGVLPVCLGEATKLAQFLLAADKEYDATVRFGVETDTDDAAGAPTSERDPGAVDEAAVRAALPRFRGLIEQVPPIYSALKRAGRPLYDYARAGAPVTPAPRTVVIHGLELTGFRGPEAVDLRVRCSKGTYIRAIARDLGRALGVGAHLSALRRTRSGPFSLAEARPLDDVLAALDGGDGAALPALSLADALGHLERRVIDEATARDLRLGRRVAWEAVPDMGGTARATSPVCLLDPGGSLVAVAEPPRVSVAEGGGDDGDGRVRTLRVFGVLH